MFLQHTRRVTKHVVAEKRTMECHTGLDETYSAMKERECGEMVARLGSFSASDTFFVGETGKAGFMPPGLKPVGGLAIGPMHGVLL